MGGTLPLLSAWLQKSSADAGRRSRRLFYSVNSLGAVVGAAAGRLLAGAKPRAGLIAPDDGHGECHHRRNGRLVEPRPVDWNRRSQRTGAGQPDRPCFVAGPGVGPALVVAMTGAVSMGLEVLASRSLAMIFGSSLQSFAVVLMAFILGIGLGSAWIASPRRREDSGAKTGGPVVVRGGGMDHVARLQPRTLGGRLPHRCKPAWDARRWVMFITKC